MTNCPVCSTEMEIHCVLGTRDRPETERNSGKNCPWWQCPKCSSIWDQVRDRKIEPTRKSK